MVPAKEDARKLKIISMGLQPKSTEERLKKTLKPPPTAEELTMYREVKKVDPKSPEAQFLKLQIKMMKDSNLEISESKWVLEICLLYTSPSPRDKRQSRMPSSA